jgi:hypothetical protein
MKRNVLPFIISFLLVSAFVSDIVEELSGGLKKGDYKVFSKYFANTVTLNLPGSEGIFSKTQAEQILRDFFFKNPSRDFSLSHQGESKEGARYFIGTLSSTNNSSYRVYCHLKKQNDTFKIFELRLEKE